MYQTPKRRFTYVSVSILIYYLFTLISTLIISSNAAHYLYIFRDLSAIFNLLYLSMLISMLAAFLVIQFGFHKKLSLQLRWKPKEKICVQKILLCFLFGFGMNIVFTLLSALVSDTLSIDLTEQSLYMGNDAFSMILCFLTVVIAAPIFEEYLFRGVVLMTLQRYGQWFAIAISSLLFALMHGSISQALGVFFLGFVISYVTVKSGSLLIGILFHMANNLLAILPIFITSELFTTIYSCCLLIVLVIGIVLFILFLIRFKKIKSALISPYDYPIKAFFKNWASITLLIILSLSIIISFIQAI